MTVYDAVFSGADLLNNQFDDLPEIGEFLDSEHVILRRRGGNPHHLVYAINESSNSNNVNVYAIAFQGLSFSYSSVARVRLAIGDKKDHLSWKNTASFRGEEKLFVYK